MVQADKDMLVQLRGLQQSLLLEDEAAGELARECAQASLEGALDRAVAPLKLRGQAPTYTTTIQVRILHWAFLIALMWCGSFWTTTSGSIASVACLVISLKGPRKCHEILCLLQLAYMKPTAMYL